MLEFPTTWGLHKYHADSTSTKPAYDAKNDVIDQLSKYLFKALFIYLFILNFNSL